MAFCLEVYLTYLAFYLVQGSGQARPRELASSPCSGCAEAGKHMLRACGFVPSFIRSFLPSFPGSLVEIDAHVAGGEKN